jgi:hypothetical protein
MQRCSRCGFVLKDFRVRGVDFPSDGAGPLGVEGGVEYPVGAPIQRTPYFQAMLLTRAEATCLPDGEDRV